MEAMITMDCSDYSENILDILSIFQQIGWGVYNPQGKIEFLPVGDNDMYDWQCKTISENNLLELISTKISRNEQIGVNLFYNNGDKGITFLADNTKDILLNLSINRRTIHGRHTDMSWYLENIIYKLLKANVRIYSYKAEELEE